MPKEKVGFALNYALDVYIYFLNNDPYALAKELGVTKDEVICWKRSKGHQELIDTEIKKKLEKLLEDHYPTAEEFYQMEGDYKKKQGEPNPYEKLNKYLAYEKQEKEKKEKINNPGCASAAIILIGLVALYIFL